MRYILTVKVLKNLHFIRTMIILSNLTNILYLFILYTIIYNTKQFLGYLNQFKYFKYYENLSNKYANNKYRLMIVI